MDNTKALANQEQPERSPRISAQVEDWINVNWDQLHCLSMTMAEFTFAAARALRSYGDGSGYWLRAAWDGAMAVGALLDCFPPPYEEVEKYVGVVGLQCQCSEEPGQLVLQWTSLAGDANYENMSMPGTAKRIISKGYSEGTALCTYEDDNGNDIDVQYNVGTGYGIKWFISPPQGSICCEGDAPPVPTYGVPQWQPIPITPDDRTYEAILRDATIDKFGYLRNFYEVVEYYPNGDFAERAFYWESVDGPIYYWDSSNIFEGFSCRPPYGPPHRDRVEFLNQGGGGGSLIPGLNPITYPLDVGCTWNEETGEYDEVYEYPIEDNPDGIIGLARRMDAIAWLINEANLIPYRACATQKPCLEGQWVTTQWESDEKMVDSGRRLRKLFRYRTKSSRDLGQLSAYWEPFTWTTGGVVVIHKGAWWGTPQVWASTEEEGKRVIRFAAAEAGIDPDQVGEWAVSSSRSPRYGMSGTMRVKRFEGFPWVAKRDGPQWPNLLAKKRDP